MFECPRRASRRGVIFKYFNNSTQVSTSRRSATRFALFWVCATATSRLFDFRLLSLLIAGVYNNSHERADNGNRWGKPKRILLFFVVLKFEHMYSSERDKMTEGEILQTSSRRDNSLLAAGKKCTKRKFLRHGWCRFRVTLFSPASFWTALLLCTAKSRSYQNRWLFTGCIFLVWVCCVRCDDLRAISVGAIIWKLGCKKRKYKKVGR